MFGKSDIFNIDRPSVQRWIEPGLSPVGRPLSPVGRTIGVGNWKLPNVRPSNNKNMLKQSENFNAISFQNC